MTGKSLAALCDSNSYRSNIGPKRNAILYVDSGIFTEDSVHMLATISRYFKLHGDGVVGQALPLGNWKVATLLRPEDEMAVFPTPADGIYESEDMALMHDAIEAVCMELGITSTERDRREAIATRVMHAWMAGGRMPLNLVNAGLESHR